MSESYLSPLPGAWMVQVARNLLDVSDGFLLGKILPMSAR